MLFIRNCFYSNEPNLSVCDPAAVETERYAGRQVHARNRLGSEVLGREDHQVRGTPVERVNKSHNVAVVLGSIWRSRHEDCLSRGGTAPEVVRLDGARCQIVFVQGIRYSTIGEVAVRRNDGLPDFFDRGAIAISVLPTGDPIVHARKLLEALVEALLSHFARSRVNDPPIKCHWPRTRQQGDVVGAFVAAHVNHDPVAVVIGVECVKNEAGVDGKPTHIDGACVEPQQTNTGLVLREFPARVRDCG